MADKFIEWLKHKDNVWFLNFFYENYGIHKQTLQRIRSRSAKLDNALIMAKDWQEGKVADGALKRRFDKGFSLQMLAVNHDWKLSDNKNVKIEASEEVLGLWGKISPTEKLVNE
jgi:hypothetical protein